jgi:flagellar hook-associated protein 2
MALSSPGIGSGLDINSIVSQLMALERRPLDQLQATTTRFQTQLSAFGRLQGAVSTLRDAARKLTSPDNWTPTTVASSNAAIVSATSTGLAPPGSYRVEVASLAAAQTTVTPLDGITGKSKFATSADVVGSGTLTIELGAWDAGQTGFTPKSGAAAVTVTIADGKDSLAAIRDAINGANAGVTASIVNDANGARLALRSTSTGAENGFRITVADADGSDADATGLSQLAFDPGSGAAQMQRTLAAANAQATINGVAISSATNTLTDVLDGLTVRLAQTTAVSGPVDLSVDRDNAAIKKSITDFANAYNDVIKLLRQQTSFDDTTKAAGPLQGDRSAVGLLQSLRSLVGGSSAASIAFTRLADIGLEPQRDGTLKVSDSKLQSAIGRLDELKAFFSRDDVGTASDGFGVLLRAFGDNALNSDGVLSTRQDGLRDRIKSTNDRVSRMEDRLVLVEQRLRAQYTKLDTNIANLNGLQGYISQQITNWNKSTG